MADDRRGRVAEGWRRIQDESQGLLRVAIINVEDAVAHLARAAEGDVESRRLIALMNGTLEMLDGDGLVCLLCGAGLSLTARRTRSWPSMRTATTLGRRQPRGSAELAFAAIRAQRVWRQRCTSICGRTCFLIYVCCRRDRRPATPKPKPRLPPPCARSPRPFPGRASLRRRSALCMPSIG